MEGPEYREAPRWLVLATMVGLCLKAGDDLAAEGHLLELLALMAFRVIPRES